MNQVKCINKQDRSSPYESITHIGGVNSNGTKWRLTQQDAISSIKAGKYSFYVESPPGDRVAVIVAVSPHGNEYIKTESDGDSPNNLLSLPECS